MAKWKCNTCGRVAAAHPSTAPDATQDCISSNCGGTMLVAGPPRIKQTPGGPPSLPRKTPVPGRCPICLDVDCGDPACLRARGMA